MQLNAVKQFPIRFPSFTHTKSNCIESARVASLSDVWTHERIGNIFEGVIHLVLLVALPLLTRYTFNDLHPPKYIPIIGLLQLRNHCNISIETGLGPMLVLSLAFVIGKWKSLLITWNWTNTALPPTAHPFDINAPCWAGDRIPVGVVNITPPTERNPTSRACHQLWNLWSITGPSTGLLTDNT